MLCYCMTRLILQRIGEVEGANVPFLRIRVEDGLEDLIGLGRDGQNFGQKVGVLVKGEERGIVDGGLSPGVTASDEVNKLFSKMEKDDANCQS